MNKKLVLMVLPLVALAGTAFAAVLITTLTATATVDEAFSTIETDVTWSAYPSETDCDIVDINNAASNAINAQFTYTETSNLNGVTYTTDANRIVELAAGANAIDVCITVDDDSPVGTVAGNLTIERVA